jgi:hypothetical protein
VNEQPDSESIVRNVVENKFAIGYSGIGFMIPGVRALPLALDIKSEYFPAEPRHAYTGEYPLTRTLLLYVNRAPGSALDPLRREFIRYIFSRDGQSHIVRSGYLPLDHVIASRALTLVGLDRDDHLAVSAAVAQTVGSQVAKTQPPKRDIAKADAAEGEVAKTSTATTTKIDSPPLPPSSSSHSRLRFLPHRHPRLVK